MKNIRQNNLIIGSDNLFNAKHKDSFYNLFRNEHDIFMLENHKTRDVDFIAEAIKAKMSLDYNHKVFIGSGEDVYLFFDLYLEYGIIFDGAILINGTYSNTIYLDPSNYRYTELVDQLSHNTEIYNLYGKLSRHEQLIFAKVNENIPTYIPPSMSSRFSLEAYGLLVYGYYEQTGLSNHIGRLSYL